MSKKSKLLFTRGFGGIDRSVFSKQRLQLPVMFTILFKLLVGARERIKQAQLRLRREQRLVIMRSMKIDKFIPEMLQGRQSCRRTIDELPISSCGGKGAL